MRYTADTSDNWQPDLSSGGVTLVPGGRWETLVPARARVLGPLTRAPAIVHVSVQDEDEEDVPENAGSKLEIEVTWQGGRGGGTAIVDGGVGSTFTIGSADVVGIKARLASLERPGIVIGGRKLRVEATVTRGSALDALPARRSTTPVVGGAPSVIKPIPLQARSCELLLDDERDGVRMSFFASDQGSPPPLYGRDYPMIAPVFGGARYYLVTVPDDVVATPVWDLWL